MPATANLRANEWGRRRQAKRMSRRFASVGVAIPASRLREIAAAAHLTDKEWVDLNFALAATEIQREERRAQIERRRRRYMWWLIFAGLCLVALNVLVCLAYVMFSLAQQTPVVVNRSSLRGRLGPVALDEAAVAAYFGEGQFAFPVGVL